MVAESAVLGSSEDKSQDAAPNVSDSSSAAVLAAVRPAAGRSPDLRATDGWAAAGRSVLRFHLARTLARVPGILAGEDIEEVHAMRVAARRMRAAWRVFAPRGAAEDQMDTDRPARGYHERSHRGCLQRTQGRLGDGRDRDVRARMIMWQLWTTGCLDSPTHPGVLA